MKLRLLPGLLLAAILVSGAAGPPIRLGVGAPMTGPDAVFGAEIRNGVEQAVQDINAKGGILGRRILVSVGDDAGDPKQGAAVANKFVAARIGLVVGHFTSGVTLAASEIYADHAMLDITPASTNPQITERGFDTIFRTCGRDDQQATVAANYLAQQKGKKIAIVYDNTSYGKELADDVRKYLLEQGVKDVLYDGADKGEKDYSNIVAKIKAAGADFVFWSGAAADAALIVKQMRDDGLGTILMGTNAIASDDFPGAGGDAVEGTLMTFPIDPRSRPQAAEAVKKFKAKNINPEAYTLYAYAAVQIIQQAAQAAGSLDPVAIAKRMHSGMHFATVLGDVSYDAKGDVMTPDYSIFVWEKGSADRLEYNELAKQ